MRSLNLNSTTIIRLWNLFEYSLCSIYYIDNLTLLLLPVLGEAEVGTAVLEAGGLALDEGTDGVSCREGRIGPSPNSPGTHHTWTLCCCFLAVLPHPKSHPISSNQFPMKRTCPSALHLCPPTPTLISLQHSNTKGSFCTKSESLDSELGGERSPHVMYIQAFVGFYLMYLLCYSFLVSYLNTGFGFHFR